MCESTTYNGWTNYETWCVALWLDNEASSSAYWREQAEECCRAAPESRRVHEWGFTPHETARMALAQRLEEDIHEADPLPESGLYSDLLGAALSEVNWYEIAGHYVDDVADEAAERLAEEKRHE